jgi:hypothetical protein
VAVRVPGLRPDRARLPRRRRRDRPATLIYAVTTVAGALSFVPGGLGVTEASMALLLARSGPASISATAVAGDHPHPSVHPVVRGRPGPRRPRRAASP